MGRGQDDVVELLAGVADALHAGVDVALATVVAVRGSTPRHVGARMAVASDGRRWGTIGGGRIEVEVEAAAREVAATGQAVRLERHLVRDLAMCCGGWMQLVVTPARPSQAALDGLIAARRAGQVVQLTTPLDGGPLRVAEVVGDIARSSMRCDAEALHEIVGLRPRAVVFGAGHVGRALGPMLASVGFEVVLCDDDDTGAVTGLRALAPGAPSWATLVVESFEVADVERALGGLGPRDHVLIVTRDHAVDQRLLEALITRGEVAYLGMIGSRGKVGRFQKRLAGKGLGDAVMWPRLAAPVGLDLGAETPAEIAISVVAQLVLFRHRGELTARPWQGGASPGAHDDG